MRQLFDPGSVFFSAIPRSYRKVPMSGQKIGIFIGIPLSVIGLSISIYVNFIRDKQRREEDRRRAIEQALLQRKQALQQRKQAQSLFYQARLQEATVDNEVAAARGTLLELETDSRFFSEKQKYGPWMFTLQLTKPQYLPLLHDAHLVNSHPPQFEEQGSSGMLWLITGNGSHAAHTNDFDYLRYLIEKVKKGALKNYRIKIDRLLYGRYTGVGFVTKSESNCNELLLEVIAGVVFHNAHPSLVGDTVWVRPSPNVDIRGCSREGDVVGFQENETGELWERIVVPDFTNENPDFKAQEIKNTGQ